VAYTAKELIKKRRTMLELKSFLTDINKIVAAQDVPDVLALLSYFEKLDLPNWKAMLNYNNGSPETTVLYESDDLKLALIYWNGYQESSIHGHPDGGGLIKVLEGALLETRHDPVESEEVVDVQVMRMGAISYIHDMLAHHKVSNPMNSPAVSLHIYRKAA